MIPFTGCLLTKGQIAIYDLEDADIVEQYAWHSIESAAGWYAASKPWNPLTQKSDKLYMHRLILGLERGDTRQVDHISHNTLDNRKSNLRVVTVSQNQQNKQNVKGYSWNKARNMWRAYIKINYKETHLGYFDNEEDARQAYVDARIKYGFIE